MFSSPSLHWWRHPSGLGRGRLLRRSCYLLRQGSGVRGGRSRCESRQRSETRSRRRNRVPRLPPNREKRALAGSSRRETWRKRSWGHLRRKNTSCGEPSPSLSSRWSSRRTAPLFKRHWRRDSIGPWGTVLQLRRLCRCPHRPAPVDSGPLKTSSSPRRSGCPLLLGGALPLLPLPLLFLQFLLPIHLFIRGYHRVDLRVFRAGVTSPDTLRNGRALVRDGHTLLVPGTTTSCRCSLHRRREMANRSC